MENSPGGCGMHPVDVCYIGGGGGGGSKQDWAVHGWPHSQAMARKE